MLVKRVQSKVFSFTVKLRLKLTVSVSTVLVLLDTVCELTNSPFSSTSPSLSDLIASAESFANVLGGSI